MKRYGTILRLLCSLALLAYLAVTVDFAPMKDLLPQAKLGFYLAGVGLMALYVLVQAAILSILLSASALHVPVLRVARFITTSAFLGVFLPGGSGGDVVMGVQLCRTADDKAGALSAILFARIASLAVMLFIGMVASFSPLNPFPGSKELLVVVVVLALAGYWVFSRGASGRLAERWLGFLRRNKVTGLALDSMLSLSRVSGNKQVVIRTLPLLLLVGLMRVWMDYLMARALGIDLPLVVFMIVVPLVNFITLIPISIAGLGVRESSYVQFLSLVGVSPAAAFSTSILSFSLTLCVCLVGACFYMARGGGVR